MDVTLPYFNSAGEFIGLDNENEVVLFGRLREEWHQQQEQQHQQQQEQQQQQQQQHQQQQGQQTSAAAANSAFERAFSVERLSIRLSHDLVPELGDGLAEYSSDFEEFEAERICGQKIENGRQFFLVKWKGFAKSQNDWKPEENLLNCQSKILQYWRRRQYDKEYRARTKDDEKSVRRGKKKKSKADEEKPKAAVDVEPDLVEKANEEMGAAPGEVLEEETEGLEEEDVCKKGKPESADAGPEVEQLKN
ncbi:hypothetical protein niasHS_004753 [Heterodera schachtii]|uniref:Chromo domain-containing protein n=1 Tax=Heterodera schachtii TaxID=97005 RepID=A0ABD2JZV5_HETSC